MSNQVNNYSEELARLAKNYAASESASKAGLRYASIQGGMLSLNDEAFPGNTMSVVVLDFVMENHYYDRPYSPKERVSPVCFAFGRDVKELAPHNSSLQAQCVKCEKCPKNVFGSAGAGKACKNVRRLALMLTDGLDDIAGAEVFYLKVPPTSCAAWSAYVDRLGVGMSLPPFAVTTRIVLVPDKKTLVALKFQFEEAITDPELIAAIMAKRESISAEIETPYSASAEQAASIDIIANESEVANNGDQKKSASRARKF